LARLEVLLKRAHDLGISEHEVINHVASYHIDGLSSLSPGQLYVGPKGASAAWDPRLDSP
jgi:hypothetical protein